MSEFMAGSGIIVVLFLFVLAVLWFFLPFAIFGTKDKLAEIIAESKKTNAELARIATELAAVRGVLALQISQNSTTTGAK